MGTRRGRGCSDPKIPEPGAFLENIYTRTRPRAFFRNLHESELFDGRRIREIHRREGAEGREKNGLRVRVLFCLICEFQKFAKQIERGVT